MPIVLDGPLSPAPMAAPTDISLEAVYPYVLPSAKSAAFGLVDQSIRSAADMLLRRARLWNAQLAAIPSVAGQSDYGLPLPANALCVKLEAWALNGVRQACITLEQAIQQGIEPQGVATDVFFDSPSDDDEPCYGPTAYQVFEGIVRVSPVPVDTSQSMVFNVNLTVSPAATTLPGVLSPYIRQLSYGALSILQALPKKDYTDLQQAALNDARFNDSVGKLAIRTTRAFSGGMVRRRPRTY